MPKALMRLACAALAAMALLSPAGRPAAAQTAVVTYHNDNARTGWNNSETLLTPQSVAPAVGPSTFGLQATVPLDSVVEAQPLVVPGIRIAGDPNATAHDVVYVVTDGNTVYAIDPTTGTVLLSRNLGPAGVRTGTCFAGGVGIGSTPVIDLGRSTMFLISYSDNSASSGGTNYVLHALDLATLADKTPPVIVGGSQTLADGSTLAFAPKLQRQRPSLLETGDQVYAAFGSLCDNNLARGWMFGWSADTLQPVNKDAAGAPIPGLTNHDATAPLGRFLSSIWMSGAGPAADSTGIYYVTGNSDRSGTTYDPVANTEQSVVRLSADTTTVLDLFTPSNQSRLDEYDIDFGAGGVILLPSTAAGQPPMAAAAGKKGLLYLLDRTNLGGYTPGGPDKVLGIATIGGCWCAPSYFNDGTPTLVSSGGYSLHLWTVQAQPTPALVSRAPRTAVSSGPNPGFFTSVSSSNGNNTIVWAVTRPVSADDRRVWLNAYMVRRPGLGLLQIFSAPAGTWTLAGHNANLVPVVANGLVYVASSSGLAIFGLAGGGGGY